MEESEVKDEVCDFDNLYRAMRHCKHNVIWKDSVAGYVKNGLANIHNLKKSVEDGTRVFRFWRTALNVVSLSLIDC